MTRSNFYKKRKKRKAREVDEGLILHLVKQERKIQHRLGVRKLHLTLSSDFHEAEISMGRDRLFALLRREDLLVPPLPKTPHTTNSKHALPIFHNEVRGLTPEKPHEIWVSDLTYLRTENDFSYLALIMDRHSRKIIGYHCGQTLEAVTCLQALEQALSGLPEGRKPIHHSDRGSQYCCHKYVKRLQSKGFIISMTEINHCYENAHAERVIGILKQEYGLGMRFKSHKQLCKAVEQAIDIYNNRRLHTSLGYRTPSQAHKSVA